MGAAQELQKRAPGANGLPQEEQKNPGAEAGPPGRAGCDGPAAGCGAAAGRGWGSAERAQTRAMTQPMKVQPGKRVSRKMEVKSGLWRGHKGRGGERVGGGGGESRGGGKKGKRGAGATPRGRCFRPGR